MSSSRETLSLADKYFQGGCHLGARIGRIDHPVD
tara:strand:+ start:2265 stop:2366 length:102 start_codon:yes stop_codon:yes gene_type:complete